MARLLRVRTSSRYPFAFTVDEAVGNGCPNDRQDVLLVQHLLRLAWNDAPASKGFKPAGETQPLTVDGMWSPKCARFLKHFQEECKRRGLQITTDERVDATASGRSHSGNSKTFYTILALNAVRNSRVAWQDNITRDPGYPIELDKCFYTDW